MKIELTNNSVIVDGHITIEHSGGPTEIISRATTTTAWALGAPVQEDVNLYNEYAKDYIMKDPHSYLNGHDGLTVHDSAYRAISTVRENQWASFPTFECWDEDDLDTDRVYRAVRRLIVKGYGRDTVYRLAGAVAKSRETDTTLTKLLNAASAAIILDDAGV